MVGISSLAGRVGVPTRTGYSASKHAVKGFTNALRMEVAHKGVTVGSAHPAWIDTDLVRDAQKDLQSFNDMVKTLPGPLGVVTSVEECARALVDGIERRSRKIYVPRVLAVLDWELSTLGHPLADFAYHCMTWHIPAGVFRGLGGSDLRALGIPEEAEYVRMYCARTGRSSIDPDHWDFYMAYNLFRLSAILQGIAGRVKDGTAASAQAAQMGAAARPLADLAWIQVEKILARR